jgi:nucleotide-binding universal stress UspA family protein
MTFRTILTHVAPGDGTARAIELACDIASRSDGLVRGLAAGMPNFTLAGGVMTDVAFVELRVRDFEQALALAQQSFGANMQHARVERELYTVQRPPTLALLDESYSADLVVLGRGSAGSDHPAFHLALGDILLDSAAPVLLAPRRKADLSRVLIAWRGTRECARAITASLPLLTLAARVDLVRVIEDSGSVSEEQAYDDCIARLRRHQVPVHSAPTPADGLSVAQRLLQEAARREAGLIVLGAYGHTRLREWVLGGVTRDLLNADEAPALFFAH